MLSQQMRRSFLQYFKTQSHTIVPSSPVVPFDDPTLLFANAGMNQFKDIFLGKSKRDYSRATTAQKCIRAGGKHNDLDNVGHTSRHLTLFEMLGNFSFGDYFKKEAIGFAWDVSTHVFGFDPDRIWVSVFKDDDEAFALWEKHLPAKRLVRFGEKENFWAMGDMGPCGPCSELLYDRGSSYGTAKNPYEDLSGERFLEFWNLVFMQFFKDETGKMSPLPKPCIDTGAGLERVVSLKMGVDSVFLTDILRSLIAQVENLSGKKYDEKNQELAPAFNVIADHIRSLSFAIADGAQPSNVERGYILRKILRRAVRYGKMLGFHQPFLAKVLPRLVETMGEDFPELKTSQNRIAEIITLEEEAFFKTLQKGENLLNQIIEKTKKQISGEDAFRLKDTYGFPFEEIVLLAKDSHLEVDAKKFHELEEKAKETSKKAQKTHKQTFDENFFYDFAKTHKASEFVGYKKTEETSPILAIVVNNKFVDTIQPGEEGVIILQTTPFYAEKGGQVGDQGILSKEGHLFIVTETLSPYNGIIAHSGKMQTGSLKKQDKVLASIDKERRQKIANNHSATHLMHWALEKVLGNHVRQAGSIVDEKHLRFDFSHHKALSTEEIRQVEELVNEKIRENKEVKFYDLSYEEAQKTPSIKQFFGEKYGSSVRVVDIEFSKELCGGTHTGFLGSIGLFKIAKESSIAAGVRRIEAVTGKEAEHLVYQTEDLLQNIADALKTPISKVLEKTLATLEENKKLLTELKNARKAYLNDLFSSLLTKKENVHSHTILVEEVEISSDELSSLSEDLMKTLKSGIVVLGTTIADRCQILVRISPDYVAEGFVATELLEPILKLIEGGGGGKKEMAQAGGKKKNELKNALLQIKKTIETTCLKK